MNFIKQLQQKIPLHFFCPAALPISYKLTLGPFPPLCVRQVSRVAEFTPCLLQIVLDNVDLPVRQAGKLTHVSKLCHACVYGS